jgi:hypothetical protein
MNTNEIAQVLMLASQEYNRTGNYQEFQERFLRLLTFTVNELSSLTDGLTSVNKNRIIGMFTASLTKNFVPEHINNSPMFDCDLGRNV